jgi:hypothetical protein
MFRKTLALLTRALRVDARSVRPHLMRFALVALVLYMLLLGAATSMLVAAPGLALFKSIASTNVWFIALVGVPYFASAIAEEKEERTIGLLKMADIGALSLLLGKWLPRVIGMLSLLAVQFPFTMLSITLGGVTFDQVLATYLALFMYLLYIGSVSLVASVVCNTTATACRLAYIVILARAFLPLLLEQLASPPFGGLAAPSSPYVKAGEFLNSATVSNLIERALQSAFNETVWPFTLSWISIETGVLFLAAWVLFEPCTRTEVSEAGLTAWQRWTAKKKGPRRRAWQAAIVGKDFRLLGGGVLFSAFRFGIYLFAVMLFVWLGSGFDRGHVDASTVGYVAIGTGLVVLALEAVISAARVFRTELNDQTWSSLVMLPRSLSHVAWAKVAGCALGCWPAAGILGLGFLFASDALPQFLRGVLSEVATFLIFVYVMLQVVLVLECTAMCSVSLGWAAWPLAAPIAAFIVGFGNAIVFSGVLVVLIGPASGVGEFLFAVLDLIAAAIVVGLGAILGRRLATKAAEST